MYAGFDENSGDAPLRYRPKKENPSHKQMNENMYKPKY
jgi:hypothetical protein